MQDRVRDAGDEVDGIVIDFDHLGVVGDACFQVGAIGTDAVGAEHDVVCVEVVAVMELHTFA